MRMGRRLRISLVMMLAFACCVRGREADGKPAGTARPKIGFLMDSLRVERWQADLDAFQKRANELGAEVLVETADGDDALQFEQAYKLLNAGIKD